MSDNETVTNLRYPAEWEEQSATWLSYPHNENEWGESLGEIRKFYIDLIDKILDFQDVKLVFPEEKYVSEVGKELVKKFSSKKFKLHQIIIPNNDIWIRDYGPFFMKMDKVQLVLDFEFNSWGEKFPPWDLDNEVPKKIAMYMGHEIESYPLILEGGALEFNGLGSMITTEQCLLNPNRNPTISKETYESILMQAFHLDEIIWLERGLEGDHTDGHIDDFVRFVDKNKVIICTTQDQSDPNYKHLLGSKDLLESKKLEVVEIPLPEKAFVAGERLPNSYANFIFVNGGIILPTFNCKEDAVAIEIFKALFPDRQIVPIDCMLLIKQGGGIHCMTKQEPV